MPNDIPDWTDATVVSGSTTVLGGSVAISAGQAGVNVSMDTPPVLLGTITIAPGANFGAGSFVPDSFATGIVVVAHHCGVVSGTPTVEVKVSGRNTSKTYADIKTQPTLGETIPFGLDLCLEGTIDITCQVGGNTDGNGFLCEVWEVLAAGVTEIVGSPNQTVPVTLSEAAPAITSASYIRNGTGTGAGGTVQNNFSIAIPGIRYLRRWMFQVAGGSGAGTSGHTMFLKGHTSATTLTLSQLATFGGIAPLVDTGDLVDDPIDLNTVFPNDASIDVIITSSANYAWGWGIVVTP